MKVKVIKSFTDKYSLKSINAGTEIEITQERFGELTAGPRGIFVEEIKDKSTVEPTEKSTKRKTTKK